MGASRKAAGCRAAGLQATGLRAAGVKAARVALQAARLQCRLQGSRYRLLAQGAATLCLQFEIQIRHTAVRARHIWKALLLLTLGHYYYSSQGPAGHFGSISTIWGEHEFGTRSVF